MFGEVLIRFIGGAGGLVGLGVVMGFSPTLVAVTLRALTGMRRPDRAIGYMLLGLVLGSTALLLLLQFVDPRSFERFLSEEAQKILVRRGIDLLAGLLFLVAAVFLWVRARKPRRPPKPRSAPVGRPWEMALIGASNAVIGVSGVATMYMTARLIRDISGNDAVRIGFYLLFVAALVSPYIALTVIWKRIPALSTRVPELLRRLSGIDFRPWEALLTLIAGLVFLGLGVWGGGGWS